jgi:hypothetical protein
MATSSDNDSWTLVPATAKEVDLIRKKCRRIVMRRAAMSVGVAAIPIPGIDAAADIGMLTRVLEDINIEFGLTPAQIDRLRPELRLIVYEMIVGMGSLAVGKVVTRQLTAQLLRHAGMKMIIKHSAKIVPVAGQVASAAIGFAAFRAAGYQHIEACAEIATEFVALRAKSVS